MRKTAVVAAAAVLAVLGAIEADAQTAAGFRAGMRFSELESAESDGGVDGFVAGAYFGIGLSDRLALQVEAVYGERGAESVRVGAEELDAAAAPSRLSMQYLDVPVLLRAGFPGERFLPSFFLGPYAGFLFSCELTPDGADSHACDDAAAAERFSPRATDFGMLAGAALDVAFGESTVFLDARYTLGLMSIESGDSPMDARHNGLEITGGFAFPLGR